MAYAAPVDIRFAYVGAESDDSLSGVRQGLSEANLQGEFLGQKYLLDVFAAKDIARVDFSAYIAVVASVEYDDFVQLSDTLPNMPVFNVMLTADSLRGLCLANALHVIPSDRMRQDAVDQWQQKNPGDAVRAQAWHEDFVKFAARDLNKRFKKKQHKPMNDYAWAGWAAVKMTSDSVAREEIYQATGMLEYLKTQLSFDGQKGSSMNFRQTGQLRQPMLLLAGNKLLGEAPVRGVAKPPVMDSLGLTDCDK